jgi:hypothetical protein
MGLVGPTILTPFATGLMGTTLVATCMPAEDGLKGADPNADP